MKTYQLTYLISDQTPEEERRTLQEKITSLIEKEGGVLNEVTLPTRRRLAYRIKKGREALMTSFNFSLEPSKMDSLEKELKSGKQILRYLILNKKPERVEKKRLLTRKPKAKKVELKELEQKIDEILEQ